MHAPFHDPLVIALENEYLGLSTDLRTKGVMARTSKDLLSWSEPFALLKETPASIKNHVDTDAFWAPELVKRKDEWRLYLCASRFGTTQSVIGLAKSKTPAGPYEYVGDVVVSQHNHTFTQANAIDPCVCADRDGKDYLIYGSFFGGIRILPLNEDGFKSEFYEGKRIAGGNHQAIEGAYVWYHAESDKFILFTSWGDLNWDYHIRVGYADEITGPYIDSQGFDMTDLDPIHHPGDKISGGYNFDLPGFEGVKATGHNSLLHDRDGSIYIVNHARPEGARTRPFLQIRRLFMNREGKPLVWPLEYDGNAIKSAEKLKEKWKFVHQSRFNNGVAYAVSRSLSEISAVRDGDEIALSLFKKDWKGYVYKQGEITAMTLRSEDGEALWGVSEG